VHYATTDRKLAVVKQEATDSREDVTDLIYFRKEKMCTFTILSDFLKKRKK
jgi:hypothetical protein